MCWAYSVVVLSVSTISVISIAMRSAIPAAVAVFMSTSMPIIMGISMAAAIVTVAVVTMPVLVMMVVTAGYEYCRPSISWIAVGAVSSVAIATIITGISMIMAYAMMTPVIMSECCRWNRNSRQTEQYR